MQFHYALVDDLMTGPEFEAKVEEQITACGDLIDEQTAAMLVVRDAGRQHQKIRDLAGRSSLVLFFGRLLAVTPPHTFKRKDESEGLVSTMTVGDESGRAEVTLWDERAEGAAELEVGDVFEIIAKRSERRAGEFTLLAMQKAACEIRCQAPQPVQEGEDAPPELVVRLLAREEPRTFSRRDGTTGEMVGALIGTEEGTARLVCWYPPLLDGFSAGEVVRLVGATRNRRSERPEYLISEAGEITATDQEVTVPLTPLSALVPDQTFSVTGTVRAIQPAREFVTRNGIRSWVRNLILGDQETEVPVVLWGDHALQGISVGEDLHMYHLSARNGRSGSLELSASWGSVVVTPVPPPKEVTLSGTVVVTGAGIFLDTGEGRYLLTDRAPHGHEVEVTGVLQGSRLTPVSTRLLIPDYAAVKERIRRLIDE